MDHAIVTDTIYMVDEILAIDSVGNFTHVLYFLCLVFLEHSIVIVCSYVRSFGSFQPPLTIDNTRKLWLFCELVRSCNSFNTPKKPHGFELNIYRIFTHRLLLFSALSHSSMESNWIEQARVFHLESIKCSVLHWMFALNVVLHTNDGKWVK